MDCVIFATGFEIGTGQTRRSGHETYGRGGKSLSEHWKNGRRTLHGFYSHGFPNLFHMGISQNALSYAFTTTLEQQAEHIVCVLQEYRARGANVVEPTAESEEDWLAVIRNRNPSALAFQQECTPGYYNNEGKPTKGGFASELFDGGPIKFGVLIADWRDAGMKGIEFE